MTTQRRRDPHLPGPRLEDAETIVGGERVTSHGLSDVDQVIAAAHADALDRVRYMWGLDRDDWLLAAEELATEHPDLAAVVLRKWCDIAVQARWHDSREPSSWGFTLLANVHHAAGDHETERAVLEEFLAQWPADRDTAPNDLQRIAERVARGCG